MSVDQKTLAVSGVQQLTPYQPGKPIEELERELGITESIKLASNENPLGPSSIALKAAIDSLQDATLYPDASGTELKRTLKAHYGLAEDRLTLGNGSNDLLELIARVFVCPDDEVIYSEYAFIVYPLVTQACCAVSVVTPAKEYGHDLDAMANAITDKTRLIFLANPNNPTGTVFSEDQFRAFMARVSEQVIVVLDEAYTEYLTAESMPNGLLLADEFDNLIVTRTFSKAWGLAGLRCGFAYASVAVTDLLNRVRQPFNVSIAALAAAQAVLSDSEYLKRSQEVNQQGLKQMSEGLAELGVSYVPSQGNFVLIDLQQPAMPIYQSMLLEGVITRPVGNYGLPNHLRVSIGLEHENARFLKALAEALA
ncbi:MULTISPECIES: histidinol-phosphate transaminase [unclassified Marinobacterium]|uniref:histidinol-phosphate transaminase n=1 Tax=unclassified Marinobacterium TaxID=2644139 RepID=UPI00156956D5|nr:Histidinol-phosphate aminotransferase 2 [Marinobacterium sp. xm-g-48]NRP83357.1 Histidinol-phosphate aminotransferase 2 [Marinobacterium sp. xm-d-509]